MNRALGSSAIQSPFAYIDEQIWLLSFMYYCFGISQTQQLTIWADTSIHLLLLKSSIAQLLFSHPTVFIYVRAIGRKQNQITDQNIQFIYHSLNDDSVQNHCHGNTDSVIVIIMHLVLDNKRSQLLNSVNDMAKKARGHCEREQRAERPVYSFKIFSIALCADKVTRLNSVASRECQDKWSHDSGLSGPKTLEFNSRLTVMIERPWQKSILTYLVRGSLIVQLPPCFTCLYPAALLVLNRQQIML